jgi:hypothetical protein
VKARALVVVGVVAALTAGCSGSSDPGDAAPPAATTTSTPVSSPSTTVDPTANGATAAGVDPSNPGPPIATATAPVAMFDDARAKLKIDVLSLKRKDKLLILTLQVTPDNSLTGPKALFTLLGNHFWSPALIDSVNLKEYDTVSGSGQLQSGVTGVSAASGQPMYLYAVFAAPPAGVTSLNLIFTSSVPALNDIPIS